MVGSTVYYLHQDALGNTRLETTTTVSVKFSSNYVPYGKNYAMMGKEVFMYTGKPYDSATGLYYEGARYYDPTTGRFTIQDSVTGTQEDPMSLNRYIYARDNPMKIVDLAGHEWWNPVSDLTAAASAVSSGVSSVTSAVTAGVSDIAGAVSSAVNGLPPLASNVAQAAANFLTSGASQVVQGVSSGLSGLGDLSDVVTRAESAVVTVVPSGVNFAPAIGSCLAGTCGAVLVAAGAAATSIGVGAAIGGAIAAGTGVAVGLGGTLFGAGLLAFSTGFAIGYVIRSWGHATPQGALNAFLTPINYARNVIGGPHNPPSQGPPLPPDVPIIGARQIRLFDLL